MTLVRGKVVSFSGTGTWRADVRLDGSSRATLAGVRVNRGLASASLTAGRPCLLDLGDHNDPNDAVLIAVWE